MSDSSNKNHSELRVEFVEREDGSGKKYYLAKPCLPVTIDLRDAALFFWVEDKHGPSMTVRIRRERPLEGRTTYGTSSTGTPSDSDSDDDEPRKGRRPLVAFTGD